MKKVLSLLPVILDAVYSFAQLYLLLKGTNQDVQKEKRQLFPVIAFSLKISFKVDVNINSDRY